MNWTRDNRAEAWLQTFGITLEYCEHVPLAEFVKEWEKTNPGRPGFAIMDDHALAIAEAQAAGKPIPSVILLKTPLGYQPLDGLQRSYATHLNNGTFVAAFIVHPASAQTIYLICRCANFILNGVQPSKEFHIQQALRLIDEQGMSPDEVAAAIGLTKDQLRRALSRRVVIAALNDQGVEAAGQVNGALDVLRPLVDKNPKMAAEVFKVHVGAKLTAEQTGELTSDILKQNSQGEMVKTLNCFKSKPDIQNRLNNAGSRQIAPSDRLLQLLRTLKTFITDRGDEVYFGTDAERTELDRMEKWLSGRLKALIKNAHAGAEA